MAGETLYAAAAGGDCCAQQRIFGEPVGCDEQLAGAASLPG
jgi:hypothetical protein